MYTNFGEEEWREMNRLFAIVKGGSGNGNSDAYAEAVIAVHAMLRECRPSAKEDSGFIRNVLTFYMEVSGSLDRELEQILGLARIVEEHPEIFDRYRDRPGLAQKIGAALETITGYKPVDKRESSA